MSSMCYSQFIGKSLIAVGYNLDLVKSTGIFRNNRTISPLLTRLLFYPARFYFIVLPLPCFLLARMEKP